MVSPLMELKPENLSGKPLGLVSFGTESRPPKGAIALVWQRKFARFGSRDAMRRPTRIRVQVLFCEPSLGMVRRGAAGDGWLGVKKAFLYYGTNFDVSLEPAPRMAGARPRFVRYITYAAGLLR
jgi:hypothetical protein